MATDVNQPSVEKTQPSYIISNSDDVDDVIVRPISQLRMDQTADNDFKPKAYAPSVTKQIPEPKISSIPQQPNYTESAIPKPVNSIQKQLDEVKSIPQQQKLPNPAKSPQETTIKQSGTNGKANVSFFLRNGNSLLSECVHWIPL